MPLSAEQIDSAPCPRCGYDLRGTIATWTDSCPLEGTCTECGLIFAWAEVIRPEKFEPRWSVEFVPGAIGFPTAVARTLARSLWPWSLWSRLKMTDGVRPGRIAAYLAFLLVILLGVPYVLTQSVVAMRTYSLIKQELDDGPASIAREIAYLQSEIQFWNTNSPPGSSQALIQSNVAQMQARLTQLQSFANTSVTMPLSRIEAWIAGVFRPTSETPPAFFTWPSGAVSPYPPPTAWHDIVVESTAAWSNWSAWDVVGRAKTVGALILMATAGAMLLPLTFIFLPVSRRRAQVQWRHVGRTCLYSLAIPIVAWFVCLTPVAVLLMMPPDEVTDLGWTEFIAKPVVWLALCVFWAAAMRNYMRIPHAEVTALLLTVLSSMVILAILWLTIPNVLFYGVG